LYVPGGKAAYPSSVLMNAIPAKVAGVQELIMVVPTPNGVTNELVLAAAHLAEVDMVITVGGAQAIAALAYGTESIPKVDKIVGPGNIYVATAKRQVFGQVGIDMIAGPSEILIICDGSTNPDWIAMDLFSQAEHDEEAQAILLCPDKDFINKVEESIKNLLPTMEREDIIRIALKNRGALIHTKDINDAIYISNIIAPEHLELSVKNPESLLDDIKHAGAIFMGKFSSEALGDYCAGPNHVLPTSGTARFSSPLGVYDFQKRSSIIMASSEGANNLGQIAATLANGEGLQAHAKSAMYRVDKE
jgi:histidinol dehydrogenase